MHKKSRRLHKRQKRQKRQKYRTRKHGRLRMRMRGGLGVHDGENIGLVGKYSFADPATHVPQFRIFTFGSDMQYNAWANLLIACLMKDVPVYILTSGNKVGIIRTLQLLELDGYFEEVLCTNSKVITEGYMPINPVNKTGRHFGGMHKYHVIYKIVKEKGLDCDDDQVIGCLLDDGLRNDEPDSANKICPAIKFEHVLNKTPATPPDFNMDVLKANLFYKLNVSKLGLPAIGTRQSKYNFTPISKIEEITRSVESGNIKIVFIDFDQTFQLFEGATQFEYDFHSQSQPQICGNEAYNNSYAFLLYYRHVFIV
jgi:hypothetical protein